MLFDGDRPLSKLANQDFKNGPSSTAFLDRGGSAELMSVTGRVKRIIARDVKGTCGMITGSRRTTSAAHVRFRGSLV
jgi:hypothetical protein